MQIKQDVAALFEYGFDAWKLDGCGGEIDLVTFNKYISEGQEKNGKSIMIENCHWVRHRGITRSEINLICSKHTTNNFFFFFFRKQIGSCSTFCTQPNITSRRGLSLEFLSFEW